MTSAIEASRSDLASHLWKAAYILYSLVNAAHFKAYVFRVRFFKATCVDWDDEYQKAGNATGGEQPARLPKSHRPRVGEKSHLKDVRTKATNSRAACCRRC